MTTNKLLLAFFLCCAGFTACKKDVPYAELTDSKENAVVYVQQALIAPQELTVFPFIDAARTFKFNAGFGAVGRPSSNISVKFEVDNAAFDSVNLVRQAAGQPLYIKFPADAYTVDGMEAAIPAGELTSNSITVSYFSKKFDPAKDYLLTMSIKDASGYRVNGKLKTVFLVVSKLAGKVIPTAAKALWDITASSEELVGEGAVNGRARAAIDGDINTFWHSNWAGAAPSFPHWLNIDMKQLYFIDKIALHPRNNNNNGFTRFDLEGSVDGTAWISFGANLVFDPTNRSFQEFPITPTEIRYIRITALQGANPANKSTHLGEINVYKY